MLAITTPQWIIIIVFGAIALAGLGLIMLNLTPILRRSMEKVLTKDGEPRPLVGPPAQLSRRKFFGRFLLAGFGGSMLSFSGISLAFLWPNLKGGFGGEVRHPSSVTELKAQIAQAGRIYYPIGKFYLVAYDENNPRGSIYTEKGLAAGGLMALYQRCVHLGCRVPFCEQSFWFECPCHGSKYNNAGEYKAGPAPRGLDRFPLVVENDVVTVNTGIIETGPPRGTDTTGQQPAGPFCIDIAGEAEEEEH